jgi:hypothetical protein
VGANVEGCLKIRMGSPNTGMQEYRICERSSLEHNSGKRRKESPKDSHSSKVVNPFTRALVHPFIGRRRDFYIPKIPLNLRNIPSVNMYINVFDIP